MTSRKRLRERKRNRPPTGVPCEPPRDFEAIIKRLTDAMVERSIASDIAFNPNPLHPFVGLAVLTGVN